MSISKWLSGQARKTARWSVAQLRGSVTSWRKMVVTIVIVVLVITVIDLLLAVLRSGVDLAAWIVSNVIGDAIVHVELRQDWFALGGAVLISLVGILGAIRGIRFVRRHGLP